jgi:hypothetical protein
MPLVDENTLATLRGAVLSPEDYLSGGKRQQLRAAFDLACSQITSRTLGFESQGRMMLRAKINGLATLPEQYAAVISTLKKALKRAEPLYSSKAYQDDDDEDLGQMKKFVNQGLKPLLDAVGQFQ